MPTQTSLISHIEEIPLNDCFIGRFQVRREKLSVGIDHLARNIERYGLIHPIVICRNEDRPKEWEIVCGQRRWLAFQELGRDKIPASIIDHPITLAEGEEISYSENAVRADMTRKDHIDTCVKFYNRYRTIKDVVAETGLPKDLVRQYVRFDSLPDDLKEMVEAKAINTDLALKVHDAASAETGNYDADQAVVIIKEVLKVDTPIQGKALKLIATNPGLDAKAAVAKAEEPNQFVNYRIALGRAQSETLSEIAEDQNSNPQEVIINMIEEGIQQYGDVDGSRG